MTVVSPFMSNSYLRSSLRCGHWAKSYFPSCLLKKYQDASLVSKLVLRGFPKLDDSKTLIVQSMSAGLRLGTPAI